MPAVSSATTDFEGDDRDQVGDRSAFTTRNPGMPTGSDDTFPNYVVCKTSCQVLQKPGDMATSRMPGIPGFNGSSSSKSAIPLYRQRARRSTVTMTANTEIL
jgi:hypothetical protein